VGSAWAEVEVDELVRRVVVDLIVVVLVVVDLVVVVDVVDDLVVVELVVVVVVDDVEDDCVEVVLGVVATTTGVAMNVVVDERVDGVGVVVTAIDSKILILYFPPQITFESPPHLASHPADAIVKFAFFPHQHSKPFSKPAYRIPLAAQLARHMGTVMLKEYVDPPSRTRGVRLST